MRKISKGEVRGTIIEQGLERVKNRRITLLGNRREDGDRTKERLGSRQCDNLVRKIST